MRSISETLKEFRQLASYLNENEAEEISKLLMEEEAELLSRDFREYARSAWSVIEPGRDIEWNWHIDHICEHLEAVKSGEITRLIINVPPRCSKSSTVSVLFPSWVWTDRNCLNKQFMSVANKEELAVRDTVNTRFLLDSEWYQGLFPYVKLSSDQNEKSRYYNTKRGYRLAFGIGSKIVGEGADYILVDDPHDSTEAQSDAKRSAELEKFDQTISTRLNDPKKSAIIIIMQRLNTKDLTGHILASESSEKWEHVIIPMEYTGKSYSTSLGLKDPRKKVGELLMPSRFPSSVVAAWKDRLRHGAAGQLQQDPKPAGGGILRQEWWRKWPEGKPLPVCEFLLASFDTAFSDKDFEANQREGQAAYTAYSIWGVFYNEFTGAPNIFLVDAWRDHIDFPTLRKKAKEIYLSYKPDMMLVEKKASGYSVIQDLRQAGIPVTPYNPDRDKVARAYAVQSILQSGMIWHPDRRWAEDFIEDLSYFPNGESSDWTDTATQGWLKIRNAFMVRHPDNPIWEEEQEKKRVMPAYG